MVKLEYNTTKHMKQMLGSVVFTTDLHRITPNSGKELTIDDK